MRALCCAGLAFLKAITLGAAVWPTAPQICRPCIAHSRKRAVKPAVLRRTPISGPSKQNLIENRDRLEMKEREAAGRRPTAWSSRRRAAEQKLSRQTSEGVKAADSAVRTAEVAVKSLKSATVRHRDMTYLFSRRLLRWFLLAITRQLHT